MTEISENNRAWLFYDGECHICRTTLAIARQLLDRKQIAYTPLQAPGVKERLGLTDATLLVEMKVLDGQGRIHGGADAYVYLARFYWWAWPFLLLAQIPGAKPILRRLYQQVAKRRYCFNGSCEIPREQRTALAKRAWVPVLLLPILPFLLIERLPAWAFMWTMAGALFLGCKWLTWNATVHRDDTNKLARALKYFLLWPGMDPKPFLRGRATVAAPRLSEWLSGILKVALGMALFAYAARVADPMAAGWIGMIGFVFAFHFGILHLLALLWRSRRVAVEPLMYKPALAPSIAELWGKRWNRGFNQVVRQFIFLPVFRKRGENTATLLTFFASGIIHELVITVPARAGYGLPTLYFTLQGTGVLLQRSYLGQLVGITGGFRGWLFMAAVSLGPVYWLFPPPFILRVFNPFLQAIGIL